MAKSQHWTDQAGKDAFILLLAERRQRGETLSALSAEFSLSESRIRELAKRHSNARIRIAERARLETLGQHTEGAT